MTSCTSVVASLLFVASALFSVTIIKSGAFARRIIFAASSTVEELEPEEQRASLAERFAAKIRSTRTAYRRAPAADLPKRGSKEWKRREARLFDKYWRPLKPPPHHHPGIGPTVQERLESQAPQARYAKYWRSLPKFKPSPLLRDVQRMPYLKLQTWRSAAVMESPANPRNMRKLQTVCHHKSGNNLLTNIMQTVKSVRHFDVWETCEGLSMPAVWRRLHMVRDPVDMILSGYRYHQFKWGSEVWSWGHGGLQDPQCFECDDDDHAVIFDSCRFNCTYFELVNRLDETSGVVTEAVSARISITSMASLMSLLGNRSDALHLSFGLFKADVTRTSACILKFLGLGGDAALQARLVKAVQEVRDPHHVTSTLHDNTRLKAFLRKHPVWGPDFRQVKQLMQQVFRHQARRWGCPEEEAPR
mmetsp:Transcript_43631/g.87986  ORF Transcript_43631/g.87986 Transcript_43631/m.87986 type:complete len:417 (+) Transcript_43631:81-1331(+)|eukprot:CAMPEP_0113818176 /NCGR_PEP_ID=MMETSP0328-20130328/109_1 /TAXON_ID=39455 /ORGANISM="Alexandrium minutum" /LENGTH=416 /DNA_ID=CAMNT_0000786111 /DNA_START=80 /DNA_END=1330 /DNA_ORIENTATION=+ /assembly_acc=CAM_ASM_000350